MSFHSTRPRASGLGSCPTVIVSIVIKEILDFINGTIQVESEAGKGTRFIVRLPCI